MKFESANNLGRTYFLIFILGAVIVAGVIWKASQWHEQSSIIRVLPVPSTISDSGAVIFGRRGVITHKSPLFLVMSVSVEGSRQNVTVAKTKKTGIWNAVLEGKISFSEITWDDLQSGNEIFAVASEDIGYRAEFTADRIYRIVIKEESMVQLPETIGEDFFDAASE